MSALGAGQRQGLVKFLFRVGILAFEFEFGAVRHVLGHLVQRGLGGIIAGGGGIRLGAFEIGGAEIGSAEIRCLFGQLL